jgi:L-ascorbate metabolism protein UlaG (beta-lactamase superfamily)
MSVNISRVLHAGYIFETATSRILFDPIFESPFGRNCYSYPNIEFDHEYLKTLTFSAVFISHHHDDHCSLESLQYIHRQTPIYMYCLHPELFEWLRTLGFTNVIPLAFDRSLHIDEFTITPTRPLDEDVDCIFQIEVQGLKILNMVDAWMTPNTLRTVQTKSPWDLVLWPFQTFREIEILSPSRHNFYHNIEIPEEFIEPLKALRPRYVVPSSCQFRFEEFSWLNDVYFPISYNDFAGFIKNIIPESSLLRIEPGETYTLSSTSLLKTASLVWIHRKDTKNAEYGVNKNIAIPTLNDYAQHFTDESSDMRKAVSHFCNSEIIEKFSKLIINEDGYFSAPKVWLLTIYSFDGTTSDYYYQIHKNQLTRLAPTKFSDWHTEIIDVRLYGALNHGESLSSLYMRINDKPETLVPDFDFASIDVLEDPLLHVLYTGRFGSYQKAQLDKLLSKQERHF